MTDIEEGTMTDIENALIAALRAWERWEAMTIMKCPDAWWALMPGDVNDAMVAAQGLRNDAIAKIRDEKRGH